MPFISPETAVALVTALGGGVAVRILDGHYRSKEKAAETDASFRSELHQEVASLRTDLRKADEELDAWKEKYYALREENLKLKLQLDVEVKAGDPGNDGHDKPNKRR